MSPGITVRRLRSMTRVCGPLSLSVSAVVPTATMRVPRIASDSAMVKRSSTVTILPLMRMVSAGCACAAVPSPTKSATAAARMIELRIIPLPLNLIGGRSLVDLDVGRLDDRPPFVHLVLEMLGQRLRRRAGDHDPERVELRPDCGLGHGGDRIDLDLVDDLGWRPGRHEERKPRRGVVARHACLGDGRYVGRGRLPPGGAHPESTQLTVLHQRQAR